jgi:hypothetical protein
MSDEQRYILRLLRKLESAATEEHNDNVKGLIGKLIHKISLSNDVQGVLETLYGVRGFEEFSMRLMWLVERGRTQSNGSDSVVSDYEVEVLRSLVKPVANGSGSAAEQRKQESAGAEWSPEDFYDELNRFGRLLEDFKRKSRAGHVPRQIEPDMLYRILDGVLQLQHSAAAIRKKEVVRFAAALSHFLHYVLDNDRCEDARVVTIIDSANLTMQTVLQSAGTEDVDSLEQMTSLLQDPRELLK